MNIPNGDWAAVGEASHAVITFYDSEFATRYAAPASDRCSAIADCAN